MRYLPRQLPRTFRLSMPRTPRYVPVILSLMVHGAAVLAVIKSRPLHGVHLSDRAAADTMLTLAPIRARPPAPKVTSVPPASIRPPTPPPTPAPTPTPTP